MALSLSSSAARSLAAPAVVLLAGYVLARLVQRLRRTRHTTRLRGPSNPSLLFGHAKQLTQAKAPDSLRDAWLAEYGDAFELATPLGGRRIMLADPKAIAQLYTQDTYGYVQTSSARVVIERLAGRGILWSEGHSHKRQRKILSPGFSNSAIRGMTPIFFDSAYKLKSAWDATLEAGPKVIDVQDWMNRISLDSIGLAGFSHDFGTLSHTPSVVRDVFNSFSNSKRSLLGTMIFVLSFTIPVLSHIPTERTTLLKRLNAACTRFSQELIARTKAEEHLDEGSEQTGKGDKSAMALLIKAEKAASGSSLSEDEVIAQMKILFLAGYETTSITLTWALIELARHPALQARLREELLGAFPATDPSWDQLTHGLPFLDAVVHETLRLHPALNMHTRRAEVDNVLPLSTPIRTLKGDTVDRLHIAKGTTVTIALAAVNRAPTLWGADAGVFRPERWLEEEVGEERAKEVQGHRHLLTFSDGTRACLGKQFALAELKAVLCVLIRNYAFEHRDGPETQIGRHRSILIRPKVEGEDGPRVPLVVRRLE